jgi:hypothetical protein
MSLDEEFGPGTLRRAHSEELMSEVGIDVNEAKSKKYGAAINNNNNNNDEDDQSLQSLRVSDRPVGQVKRRQRHNSAESAAEMSRKFQHCPEYADFYTGQVRRVKSSLR